MRSMNEPRTYQFKITVVVNPHQDGYDDPEWIADAAWGALTNEYGYECVFGDIAELPALGGTDAPLQIPKP